MATEQDARPRFMRAAEVARCYVEQLAEDADNPDRRAALYERLSGIASKIGATAQFYDFAIGHQDLEGSKAVGNLGIQLAAELRGDNVPAGIRDIYTDFYEELRQYDVSPSEPDS